MGALARHFVEKAEEPLEAVKERPVGQDTDAFVDIHRDCAGRDTLSFLVL